MHHQPRARVSNMNDDTSAAESNDSTHIGTGWISGVLSVVLGAIGLGAVLCFRNWDVLTMTEARPFYAQNLALLRGIVHVVLVAAFLLGIVSVSLRPAKWLGLTGCMLVLVAALLGGSQASLGERAGKPFYLG